MAEFKLLFDNNCTYFIGSWQHAVKFLEQNWLAVSAQNWRQVWWGAVRVPEVPVSSALGAEAQLTSAGLLVSLYVTDYVTTTTLQNRIEDEVLKLL